MGTTGFRYLLGRTLLKDPAGRIPAFLVGWGVLRAVALNAANEFDAKLDRDQLLIEGAADRLHTEWRSAEVDAFAMAMEHGAITADDFA